MAKKLIKKTSGKGPVVHKSHRDTSRRKRSEVRGDWWNAKNFNYHDTVSPLCEAIDREQETRRETNTLGYSIYTGRGIVSLDGVDYAEPRLSSGLIQVMLARSICESANSKLAKNKVRVLYMTEGGNWKQRSRAKRITKIVNGTFYSTGLYAKNQAAQADSTWCDLGAVYFYKDESDEDNRTVKCERVPGSEIRVDYMDGRYQNPESVHRVKSVPRSKLYTLYPDKEREIKKAKASPHGARYGSAWVADCVEVRYSWKRACDGEPGVCAVTIDGATLDHSEWKHDWFPFVFHRWMPEPFGFYGKSITQLIAGMQLNCNKVVDDIQEHVDLSTGYFATEMGAGVNTNGLLSNIIGRHIEYQTVAPQFISPPSFQMEKLEWLEWIWNKAYEVVGVSQMYATAKKPSGLDSGAALREYNDQNSERFQIAEQRYEQTYVDAAKIIVALYEEMYQEGGDFKVRAQGSKILESISWSEARMDEQEYVVRPVPTSFLPSTPAAKLQTVQEMMQSGMLTREEGMLLLDYPDLERIGRFTQSSVLNIERMIDIMTDPDGPQPQTPNPRMNLQEANRIAVSAFNDAQLSNAPPEVITYLDQFIQKTQELMKDELASQQPQPPMPPAQPAPAMAQLPPPAPGAMV